MKTKQQKSRESVARWLARIGAADKEEKDWREESKRIYSIYRGKLEKQRFNILWSNTETLRPAIYNSAPVPDIRRRFKDKDPVGKSVSEVLNRTVTYLVDTEQFEETARLLVLDMLLCGRGVPWVEYEADVDEEGADDTPDEEGRLDEDSGEIGEVNTSEPADPSMQIKCEKVIVKLVNWQDFRHGPGKTWQDVEWVARILYLGKDQLTDLFGEELTKKIPLGEIDGVDKLEEEDKTHLKTAKIYEIWDKSKGKRIYLHEQMSEQLLLEEDPPIDFRNFFPCPRPVHAVVDSTSLIPIPLYRLYEDQAKELNEITANIRKLVKVVKVRGLYHPQITELEDLMESDNNEMLPVQNVSAVIQLGGLDKAIWMMPIEMIVNTITALYNMRQQTKQTIYEITGISDIIRGSSNASETLGAQQIKAQWGTMRLQDMQKEFQRLIRDVIRLMAEIVSEQFQPETIKSITQLDYPTEQDKQINQMKAQQMLAQGQPQSPSMMRIEHTPSWEQIFEVMKSEEIRSYKVDIETDSTVTEGQNRDMKGLSDMLQGIAQVMQAVGPAVQAGVMPAEAGKEIFAAVIRRARLGTIVEDAMDAIVEAPPQQQQQQQPPPNPTEEEMKRLAMVKQEVAQMIQEQGGKLSQQAAQNEQQAQMTQQQALQAQQGVMDTQQALGTVAQTHGAVAQGAQNIEMQSAQMAQAMQMMMEMQQRIAQDAAMQSQMQSQAVIDAIKTLAEITMAPKSINLVRSNGKLVGGTAKTKLQ